MLDIRQIHPLTDFLRSHKIHIDRIKETQTPELLTVNGRAEVVGMDPGSFQDFVNRAQRAELIEAIQKGIAAADRGELKPAAQVLAAMRAKYVYRVSLAAQAEATTMIQHGFVTGPDWTPDGRFITCQQVSVGDKQMNCTTTLCRIPAPR